MTEVVMKNSVFGDIELENNLVIIGPSYIKKEILEACSLKYNIKFFVLFFFYICNINIITTR